MVWSIQEDIIPIAVVQLVQLEACLNETILKDFAISVSNHSKLQNDAQNF